MPRSNPVPEVPEGSAGLNDTMKTWLKDARQQSEELKFLLEQSKRVASEATEAIKKDYAAQLQGLREQVVHLQAESSTSHAACKKALQAQEELKLQLQAAKSELDVLRPQIQARRLEESNTVKARETAASNQLEKVANSPLPAPIASIIQLLGVLSRLLLGAALSGKPCPPKAAP
eukprot:125831-Rhodomonas_salina.2